jgi:hypothetical protein
MYVMCATTPVSEILTGVLGGVLGMPVCGILTAGRFNESLDDYNNFAKCFCSPCYIGAFLVGLCAGLPIGFTSAVINSFKYAMGNPQGCLDAYLGAFFD